MLNIEYRILDNCSKILAFGFWALDFDGSRYV